jgi:hypothetical protein
VVTALIAMGGSIWSRQPFLAEVGDLSRSESHAN